ncbi:methyltransferase [Streptomyces abyssalis]|uniref:Methyltransferase n=1 Tax=Streptomyces abyssalis TaxID=933944 RepID=A0A1E7JMS9_9ACTN|nr:SAM-dependent methyltransferase [Streptomyces abyssalis]OEU87028.1 methyltransferase [Streptomyces abyssalis]OEU89587.1 methyltransferase [Streptomyces abyssalis]OEV31942.1 methyltransferase [Streptomyces nanshensis]
MTTPGKPEIDTSRPHSARMYDYYLGGKDWYPVDEEAAERVLQVCPQIRRTAETNRAFMHRATRTLAAEHGIRQFVDIGTGIPTSPNLHQVAQEAAPDSRVVYADHDATVLEYAHVLMRSTPEGRTAYINADVREDAILDSPRLREVIDLDEPVALSLVALLHFVPDDRKPYEIVSGLLDQLASGSFLVLSHCTADFDAAAWMGVKKIYDAGGTAVQLRSKEEVERFFDGLELIDPQVTAAHDWRPEEPVEVTGEEAELLRSAALYAAVGRKP